MTVARFSIVCLSPEEWDADLPTNRQQIMRRAAERGHDVVFVETGHFLGKHLLGLLRSGRGVRLRRLVTGQRVLPRVTVRRALNALPWGQRFGFASGLNARLTAHALRPLLRRLPRPVVVWVYDPCGVARPGAYGEAFAVYDCVDDYAEQAGPDPRRRAQVAAAERRAAAAARLVFATTSPLYERHRTGNRLTELVPNAADVEHFASAGEGRPDEWDLADLPRPVVGFAGNLTAAKVDFDLLEQLADAAPGWSLLLAGPGRDDARERLERLRARENVRWVGLVPYARLPGLVGLFDVALIPYVSTRYTSSCFPLKLYEYLAAGKPVVATGLPALAGMAPDVQLVAGVEAVVAAVSSALELRAPEERRRRVALASAHTWEARTSRLLGLIERELAAS